MVIADLIYPELKTTDKLKHPGGDNYIPWKLKLDFYLSNYGVGYVLTDHIPAEDDADRRNQWLSDNETCCRILYLTADSEFFRWRQIKDDVTAKSLMDSIESICICIIPSMYNRREMFNKFTNYRMREGHNINRHIFRLRALARKLELGGVPVTEEIQVVVLMNSLPDSWADVVEGLILNDLDKEEKLSLDNVCRKLMIAGEVRRWREGGDGGNYDPNKHMKKICYSCGESGHFYSDCSIYFEPDMFSTNNSMDDDKNFAFSITKMGYPRLKTTCRLNHMGTWFDVWKHQITRILKTNKVNYVLTEPKVNETWLNDDLTCRHIILGAMEEDLFLTFHNYPSAKTLMDAIDCFFNSSSLGRKMNMFNRYVGYRMSDDSNARHHIAELESMAREMETAGIAVPDEMQAVVLMESLPVNWEKDSHFVFMKMDMEMVTEKGVSLEKVKKTIRDLGDVRNLVMSSSNNDRKQMRLFRGNCYSCGKSGHHQSNCPN